MANQKVIPIKIKVDGKEIDLSKTSMKQFNAQLADAKKKLNDLTVGSSEWKALNAEIKNAGTTMKDYSSSLDDAGTKTKSYRAEIADLNKELRVAKETYGDNSVEVQNLQTRISGLRDKQKEAALGTQELDDALSNLPGPIGQVGQAMGQFESVVGSTKSAMGNLIEQFPLLKNAWVASGIGLVVTLIAVLAAALIDAAKSFEPLQQAFAGIKDAVGALFNALKPITDFLLKVFVGVIDLVAGAINGLASLFGGVSNGLNQQSLALEKQLKFQKAILDNYNAALSKNLAERLKLEQDYVAKQKEITDAEYKNEEERYRDLYLLMLNYSTQKTDLRAKEYVERKNRLTEINKLEDKAGLDQIDNARVRERVQIQNDKVYNLEEIKLLKQQNNLKKGLIKIDQQQIEKSNLANKDQILKILQDSYNEQAELGLYYDDIEKKTRAANREERKKRERQYTREDIAAVNERTVKILELTTQLIKEESARNVQAAKDAKQRLIEQQRVEREQAELAGISTKKLKQKQAAELKVADEEIRKAEIQHQSYLLQIQIDAQNRLATESGKGSEEYFKARRAQLLLEAQQEYLIADGNQNDILNAREKFRLATLELDKQEIQSRIDLLSKEYDGLYEGTKAAFDKQRELEIKAFELQQKEYQNNFDMLEALKKEHVKRMSMIDVAELQAKADIEGRKAEAVGSIITEHYDMLREQNDIQTKANIIAAGDNAEAVEVIQLEHLKREKEIGAMEIENKKSIEIAKYEIAAQFGQLLGNLADQLMNAAQGRDEKQFNNAKALAKASVVIEKAAAIGQIVASTGIANAKAVAASPLTLGQPWVTINTVSAALSIAGVIAAGIQQISQINNTQFQKAETSTSSATSGNGLGRGYAEGGMIEGPRHAGGGVMINAEGGEAVMTRGAVTMFGPMLSALNQMGGGTSFSTGAVGASRFDNPARKDSAIEMNNQIIKTYVVESELTTIQQRQARLKDLSTL
jgi:hypothetical protein